MNCLLPALPCSLCREFAKEAQRSKAKLPTHVTDTLNAWWQAHLTHPYPDEATRRMFVEELGITPTQASRTCAQRHSM